MPKSSLAAFLELWTTYTGLASLRGNEQRDDGAKLLSPNGHHTVQREHYVLRTEYGVFSTQMM